MCLSRLGQIIYAIITFVTIACILTAMFTPSWSKLRDGGKKVLHGDVPMELPTQHGLFSFICGSGSSSVKDCQTVFQKQPIWVKIVLATMIVALLVEIVAFLYNFLACCACCCREFFLKPLPILAGICAIFLFIALIVFGMKNKDDIPAPSDVFSEPGNIIEKIAVDGVGYSFYIACGAFCFAAINVVVGIITVFFAKSCL
ncbi:Protein CLC-1 [Aphelenchoides avenae]|nr:Protein CLC-1 [Aphelenchus avenae]